MSINNACDTEIYVFQERHTSRIGQLEIARKLVWLHDKCQLRHIALEGVMKEDGSLSVTWFHELGDREAQEDIAVQLLKTGEINCAEFIALVLPDVTVHGIERREDYEVTLERESILAVPSYLAAIALPLLTEEESEEVDRFYETEEFQTKKPESQIRELSEFIISKNEEVQRLYDKFKDDRLIIAEDMLNLLDAIEAKANIEQVKQTIDSALKEHFQNYRRFFEVSIRRSITMVENTLTLLKKYPLSPIGLVIGAGHSAKVVNLLKSLNISFKITPEVISRDTGDVSNLDGLQFALKRAGLSVDTQPGQLGYILSLLSIGGVIRKPETFIDRPLGRVKGTINFGIKKLAEAVRDGASISFDQPPYNFQKEFNDKHQGVIYQWDTFRKEGRELIGSFKVKIKDRESLDIWFRAVAGVSKRGDRAGRSLDKLLGEAIEEIRAGKGDVATVQLGSDVLVRFSPDREDIKNSLATAEDEENLQRSQRARGRAMEIARNVFATFSQQEEDIIRPITDDAPEHHL